MQLLIQKVINDNVFLVGIAYSLTTTTLLNKLEFVVNFFVTMSMKFFREKFKKQLYICKAKSNSNKADALPIALNIEIKN